MAGCGGAGPAGAGGASAAGGAERGGGRGAEQGQHGAGGVRLRGPQGEVEALPGGTGLGTRRV